MPLPQMSRQEVRLGRFAASCSAVYGVLALLFAVFPGWTFRVAGLGAQAELTAEVRFWQVLGVAMMATISVACAVVAHSPRERRVALLPVLVGQLSCSAMALLVVAGLSADAVQNQDPLRALRRRDAVRDDDQRAVATRERLFRPFLGGWVEVAGRLVEDCDRTGRQVGAG